MTPDRTACMYRIIKAVVNSIFSYARDNLLCKSSDNAIAISPGQVGRYT